MKSDLTCPVEVTRVTIQRGEDDTKENGQIVCLIEFFNLSEKVIDSLQMNIVCYNAAQERLGGRLVRAAAVGEGRSHFTGAFAPEHVEGAVRVEASVEKVWFQDGVIWRREERNVREYTPNALPAGRELDRLRAVAGPDAQGYAREDDIVWMCVCGRANPTSDDRCLRCQRERAQVLKAYSFAAIDSTVGRRERQLEQKTKDTLRRSSEQTVEQQEAVDKKRRRHRRRITALIAVLAVAAVALAMMRWGIPYGAYWYAQRQLAQGQVADAKTVFEWVEEYWPGMLDAAARADEAEEIIIQGLITSGTDVALSEAARRAQRLTTEAAPQLYAEAVIARAQLAIDAGETDQAEELLAQLPQNEAAAQMLRELVYDIAAQAKERLDYPTAIERFESLGDYDDAREQLEDSIYLYGRQLMRAGRYEEAAGQLLKVTGVPDAIALIRQCRYALALEKQDAGELEEAAALYESLGIYEEAETRGRICRYQAGMALLADGDLEGAAEQLALAEDYEDAAERFADAAFTLGSTALEEGDYQAAIGWLERLKYEGDAADALNRAVYGFARQLEDAGQKEEAALEYATLGGYEDAAERAKALIYAVALEEMARSPEDALTRFEGLGDYSDAQDKVLECRYKMASAYYNAGDYAQALALFELLGDYSDSRDQARRCRYARGTQLMDEQAYEEAAAMFEACGAYLDAEDRVMQANYARAAALEESGEYELAAKAFAQLGSYEDAKQRVTLNEDAWLGATYTGALMDMELGDYASVIEALEDVWQSELPERYADIPKMYEQACLTRAQELTTLGRPLDALPVLERIPDNSTAQKRMEAYVYQIIGRWKDTRGTEYVFRRDGSCSIAGQELYFGGSGYEITVGDEPYPTKAGYSLISIRNGSLTLRDLSTGSTVRLSYLGEPTPPDEAAQDDAADEPEAEAEAQPEETAQS